MRISSAFQQSAVPACKNARTALRSCFPMKPLNQIDGRPGSTSGIRSMLRSSLVLFAALGLASPALSQTSCPAGTTTSISGVVYAPNGTDPLPNVTVYVPTATVDAFTPGVSCPLQGATLPGNPSVGTTTATDGSFTINDVPVATSVPLVIVSGRWRRQVTVDTTGATCGNTVVSADLTRFPRNQTEGDIPKFAVATGSVDQVECVLRKVGIDPAEFTNPSGNGRIQFYEGDGSAVDPPARNPRNSGGAVIDSTTPTESTLMSDASLLSSYDVLMLPCEGGDYVRPPAQLSNLVSFANSGGRVYSSHYAYSWLWTNPPFNTVASWTGNKGNGIDSGTATVDTTFAAGKTLYNWLQLPAINASTSPGQITLYTIKNDFSGINSAINQSWLTLNATNNPVMQFVFDTPVGQSSGQCGRVLFNEYHVENGSSSGSTFPAECSSGAMTPQEKLLEYSLFELTDDGGQGSISPTALNFGNQPLGITSAAQTVTFTNNSTFQVTVSLVNTTGDFAVSSNGNGCTGPVKGGASCAVAVTFTPTALGARTGTLNIGSGSQTLTATLTGNGVPDLTVSSSSLDFGSVDVGASTSRTFNINNTTPTNIAAPGFAVSGDFSASSACGASIPANSSCTVTVTFAPSVYGPRTGTLTSSNTAAAYSLLNVALTGNGLDFSMAMSPASGTIIAGRSIATTAVLTPLGGFANPVTLSCTTNAPGSACTISAASSTSTASNFTVSITTTSQYTVVGYGGMGEGWLALIGLGGAWLLWFKRKGAATLLRSGAVVLVLLAGGTFLIGCGGMKPAMNSNPTTPGNYTYTVQATDGTITHKTTYSLNVTAK